MESVNKNKESVLNAIDKELTAFVKEELRLRELHHYDPTSYVKSKHIVHVGENAFIAEKKAFQDEIQTLRQESSRIEELENENRNLRSELNVRADCSKGPFETDGRKVDDPSHVCPGVDGTELAEARDRLEELKKSYGQLVGAHRLLKEKYKLAQQTNRKWDRYYQNVSQRSKDEKLTSAEIEPKNISNPTNGQQKTPSVLTMSSLTSLSNVFGSVSPSNKLPLDTRAFSQCKDLVSGIQLPVKTSSRSELHRAQDVFDIPPDPESDILAETCDESQNESVKEHSLIDQREDPVDQKIEGPAKPVDDGSDYPVFVAERSQKRKRCSSFKQGNREVHDEYAHCYSKQNPIHIKSELDSSPINPVSFPGILDPQDSIDLDEVGEKHFTPRKHRRLVDERRFLVAGLRAPVSADFEILVEHGANDRNSKSLQDQTLDSKMDEESDQRLDGDIIGSEEDGESDQPCACNKSFFMKQGQAFGAILWEEQRRNNAKTAKSMPPKVLKNADPNIKLLPRSSGPSIDRGRPLPSNRRDDSSARISMLTEDGEEFRTMKDQKSSHALRAVKKAKPNSTRENPPKTPGATGLHQRLDTLLSKPPPQTDSLVLDSPVAELKKSTKSSKTLDSSVLRIDGKSLVTPTSRCGHVADKADGGTQATKSTRPILRSRAEAKLISPTLTRMHEPREVLPVHKSLRARPAETLCATDFRLNPARNQGYDYPFSEVVRDRNLRKCMPGCKKPGCCGTIFRKAVEIGGYTSPRKIRLSDPSAEDDAEEDDSLLEDYLGDNKSHLKGMPARERQELLLQARTEQFANVHAKHRYVHRRAQSPPGYWDTDMPSTIKQKEYRAAATAYEMEKTAEMYKEAMRPDGLYKFRDE